MASKYFLNFNGFIYFLLGGFTVINKIIKYLLIFFILIISFTNCKKAEAEAEAEPEVECVDCIEAVYVFDPIRAGVTVVFAMDISSSISSASRSFDYGGFGKDNMYFYYLDTGTLKIFSGVDFSFFNEINLLSLIESLAISNSLPVCRIDLNNRNFTVRQGSIFITAYFSNCGSLEYEKVIQYNTLDDSINFMVLQSDITALGYNPDLDFIWVYTRDIYSTTKIINEYSYDDISGFVTLVNTVQFNAAVDTPVFVNSMGVWRRNLNYSPGLVEDEISYYANFTSVDSIYKINFKYLGYTSYHIIPEGEFLWTLTDGKIFKLQPNY
jgi:hypothetical protein